MGATASTVKTFNEVASAGKRGETYIPIEGLHNHVRIFQNQKDGDVLILADKDGDAFLGDPASSEYHEVFISRRGQNYLDKLGGALSFQATKALLDKVSEEKAARKPTAEGQEVENELTLYQMHLRDKPSVYADAVAATPRSNRSTRSKDGRTSSANSVTNQSMSTATATKDAGAKEVSPLGPSTPASAISGQNSAGNSRSVDAEAESFSGKISVPMRSPRLSRGFEGDPQPSPVYSNLSRAAEGAATGPSASSFPSASPFARARSGGLQNIAEETTADAKSVGTARLTPRRTSVSSKDFDDSPGGQVYSPRHQQLLQMSPRSASAPLLKDVPSNQATAGASPTSLSCSDSKDSKDSTKSNAADDLPLQPGRAFAPVAYLPPSEHHRRRILEEDLAMQKSVAAHLVNVRTKQEAGIISPRGSPQRDGMADLGLAGAGRPPSCGPSSSPDAKGEMGGSGTPRLSPRGTPAQPPLSPAADGKPPSLRSVYNPNHAISGLSHASVSTSAMAGIADVASTTVSFCPNAECCPVCQQELLESSRQDTERYESHVEQCRMRREMQSALVNIDQHLEPKLEELTQFNLTQLNMVYANAMDRATEEFEQCAAIHAQVKSLLKRVLRVSYDTSLKRIAKLQGSVTNLQDEIAAHQAEAESHVRQGHHDAQRKVNACAYLARMVQHIADKLNQKQQMVLRYSEYLVGVRDFQVLRKLGKGSFAAVYLARMRDTRQVVAMKVLSKRAVRECNLHEQIMKERTALVMASRHPDYFVRLLYCFQNQDNLFFVMEYMQGGDCLALISTMKRFPEYVAQHFIAQVSLAVRHLHTHGVIHRDIKPDNVMISGRGHAKLGDFGSVHPIHPDYMQKPAAEATEQAGTGVTNAPAASSTHESLHLHSIHSESLNHHGGRGSPSISPKELGAIKHSAALLTSPRQLQTEIASAGYRHLMSRKSSKASNSNSLWLEQDIHSARGVSSSESFSASASGNLSSSSMSSLYFHKAANGPVMTNTFEIVGNYFYASPEMAAGACVLNQSVDWWAVGVLLFHMLSGTTPFEGLTKAATLDNIEHKRIDWDPLPVVSAGCEDFLKRILQHGYETRLGSKSGDEVIGHEFFTNLDFAALYDGYGPIYPRPPRADESSPDYYCFNLLTEQESLDVPQFQDNGKRGGVATQTGPGMANGISSVRYSPRSPRADYYDNRSVRTQEAKAGDDHRPSDDEAFQDFDYHPF